MSFISSDAIKHLLYVLQIGTIIEGPADPPSTRLTRKEKKRTVVDQLLADEEAKTYYKRKFLEIQEVCIMQIEMTIYMSHTILTCLSDISDKAERRKEVLQTSKKQTKTKLAEGLLIIGTYNRDQSRPYLVGVIM